MDPLNPFAALDDMAAEACETAFAIRARIEPYTAPGNYGDGRPDTDRVPIELRGVLSFAAKVEPTSGSGADRFSGPGRVAGQSVVFGISARLLRQMDWEIQPGDRVVLLDVVSPFPTRYRIARLAPTDMGDLELILNEANEG